VANQARCPSALGHRRCGYSSNWTQSFEANVSLRSSLFLGPWHSPCFPFVTQQVLHKKHSGASSPLAARRLLTQCPPLDVIAAFSAGLDAAKKKTITGIDVIKIKIKVPECVL